MSETQLRQLLHDAADLAPLTLDRPMPVPVRRRRWTAAVAMTAAAASVAAIALLVSSADDEPRPPQPAASPSAAPSPSARPSPPAFFGDDQLRITTMPNAKSKLSREQAELIMVNSSQPPPLRPMNGLPSAEWKVTLTLARVSLVGPVEFLHGSSPREFPLAWIASWDRGPSQCQPGVSVVADVLAADGSAGFQYNQGIPACDGQPARPTFFIALEDMTSVAWTVTPAVGSRKAVVHFRIPTCARGHVDLWHRGLVAISYVPVGQTCTGTKAVSQPVVGSTVDHAPLGPFRQTYSNTMAPLLKAWPSYPPTPP
jgi:hypothetical protein